MDDDGNQILAGPEQVTYVDENGNHIPDEKAKKMLKSEKYFDNRILYSKRAAKLYNKVPPQPKIKKQADYMPPNPNQANELIANMNAIFAKARAKITNQMEDLQMIEEDAATSHITEPKKYESRRERSHRNRYEAEPANVSSRSRSQIVESKYLKSMSNTKNFSRGKSQKSVVQPKQYATAYNPYTGQYYQYEVPGYNQTQQQPTEKNYYDYKQESTNLDYEKKSKEAELDAKIARLQAKLDKSTLGNSSSSRNRTMKIEKGEKYNSPKMVSPNPPVVSLDNKKMDYRMHYYSGIEDTRSNLLKAEMIAKDKRETIRLERAYNQVLEERYSGGKI